MRQGYDADTLTSMYHSLARETFRYFDLDPSGIVPFEVRELRTFGGALNFGPPTAAMAATIFGGDERAESVVFNELVREFMYEDEAIGSMLHEIVHSMLPFTAGHGFLWANMTEEVGGWYRPTMTLRNHHILADLVGMDLSISCRPENSYPAIHPFTPPLNFTL